MDRAGTTNGRVQEGITTMNLRKGIAVGILEVAQRHRGILLVVQVCPLRVKRSGPDGRP
jgi:hypothetical protein